VYGSCLLAFYLDESAGNWMEALVLYNGGYRQLERYLAKRGLVAETRDYVLDVFHAHEECKQGGAL
jgi:hypothetical protein